MRLIITLFIISTLLLSACGVGVQNSDLPSERPKGKISGKVLGGLYQSGEINVYTAADSDKRNFIAKTEILATGDFSLEFAAESQPLLIEASNGAYIDPDSLQSLSNEQDLVMTSILQYESGEEYQVSITPVTHLASGLVLHESAMNSAAVSQEQWESTVQTFQDLYGTDLNDPQLLFSYTEAPKKVSIEGDEKHGIVVLAFSQLANRIASEKTAELQGQFNLASLSALMYEDIRADGLLNGMSLFEDGTQKPLAFAEYPLNFSFYRTELAEAMYKTLAYSQFVQFTEKTEQQDYLLSIANANSPLFGDTTSEELQNATPEVKLITEIEPVHSGLLELDFLVKNVLQLEQASLLVDDTEHSQIELSTPTKFSLDTHQYSDGEHQLKIDVLDIFGNTGFLNFSVVFDNTAPKLTVSSLTNTNKSPFVIQGSLSEVSSINVNGAAADLSELDQWSKEVTLAEGVNEFVITAIDLAGNEDVVDVSIVLDTTAPILTYINPIETKFSNNDGTFFIKALELMNQEPLYVPITKMSLNGTEETRENLETADIVFFEFNAVDTAIEGVDSATQKVQVEYRYSLDDTEVIGWTEKLSNENSNNLLISLSTEMLGTDWFKTAPEKTHKIDIKVTDLLGNSAVTPIVFKSQFYVPDVDLTLSEEQLPIFTGEFSNREDFVDKDIVGASYRLHNNTGYPYRIRLSDNYTHTVVHEYEEMKREHKVRLKETDSWRKRNVIGLIPDPIAGNVLCPTITEVAKPITSLWKNNININDKPVEIFPPVRESEISDVDTDVPLKPDTEWTVFKPAYQYPKTLSAFIEPGNVQLGKITYNYDYSESETSSNEPGIITDWLYLVGTTPVKSCEDNPLYSLEQKTSYTYISEPGYPANIVTLPAPETLELSTSAFRVFDEDQTEISSDNTTGWYTIPAGHRVTIQKIINTLNLDIYNDIEVVDDSNTEYGKIYRLDKSLSWLIGQDITIETQFNPDAILNDDELSVKTQNIANAEKGKVIARD